MRETGELIFTTSKGGTRVVRVPDPAATVTQFTADQAVNRILTANPFDATVGNLVALKRADRIKVDRTVLIQPA